MKVRLLSLSQSDEDLSAARTASHRLSRDIQLHLSLSGRDSLRSEVPSLKSPSRPWYWGDDHGPRLLWETWYWGDDHGPRLLLETWYWGDDYGPRLLWVTWYWGDDHGPRLLWETWYWGDDHGLRLLLRVLLRDCRCEGAVCMMKRSWIIFWRNCQFIFHCLQENIPHSKK